MKTNTLYHIGIRTAVILTAASGLSLFSTEGFAQGGFGGIGMGPGMGQMPPGGFGGGPSMGGMGMMPPDGFGGGMGGMMPPGGFGGGPGGPGRGGPSMGGPGGPGMGGPGMGGPGGGPGGNLTDRPRQNPHWKKTHPQSLKQSFV